ncbi:Transporter [Dissulfuribacter thermophilus]|uniref:Transporter n=1 Tax=Dissulfuribacter thermophilus TaxID=1156395 RepID=A0A1B9F3C2_9BACT|nr:SO_0444 family Cu/Zn efflux transporter [Dissulfuribacter thermophilus]OCC14420.1 Transporter [Dissulfuribacter thermophilus]
MLVGEILKHSWNIYSEMAPYLMLGFVLAGLSYAFLSPEFVKRRLGGNGFSPVLKGALYGIPLPLCSCSVLPIAVSLKRQGAGIGAVGSFLISTPQTGLDSIVVTWSFLGAIFAIFRAIAAFVSGLIGGTILDIFARWSNVSGYKKREIPRGESDVKCELGCVHFESQGCSCTQNEPNRLKLMIDYAFKELPREICGPLLLGIFIGGLIEALVPNDLVEMVLRPGVTGLFLALILGIPMYVCATSSIPIALAFLLKGATPGAAFVFLMTGPVTNTAQISAIYNIFGKRNLLIYLVTVCTTALVFGALLDFVVEELNLARDYKINELVPFWIEIFSSIMLSLLILRTYYEKMLGKRGVCGG